jgi:hypothetical protein
MEVPLLLELFHEEEAPNILDIYTFLEHTEGRSSGRRTVV